MTGHPRSQDEDGRMLQTTRHFSLDLPENPDEAATPPGKPVLSGGTSSGQQLPPRVADPGVSEDSVLRGTGAGWDTWLARLDAWGAPARTHAEIARHLQETYDISGWWAQSVTVGYERARGLRAVHERPDGFSVSVSKTIAAPVEWLFPAFVDDAERDRWLEGVALRRRTSKPPTTARFDLLPGDARLVVGFTARGPEKATVTVQVERLSEAREVERWRGIWREQLVRLAAWVEGRDLGR